MAIRTVIISMYLQSNKTFDIFKLQNQVQNILSRSQNNQ